MSLPNIPKQQSPVSVWREKDVVDGELVDTLVGILRGRGCYWASESGCLMCGYNCDTFPQMTDEDIFAQIVSVMEQHQGERFVKIYTSGSFFDDREISPGTRDLILSQVGQKADRLLIESRPEFINTSVIDEAMTHVKRLEVAVGLESASDDIRARCINKGFTFDDFQEAANVVRDSGASLRTYLLLKPPYLTERRAVEDAVDSAIAVDELSDTISFNPVNVQRGTVVENLWKRNLYRPPWLWSLIEVLKRSKHVCISRLMSSPTGGGSVRGVHNCRNCDKPILEKIGRFSLDGELSHFDALACSCFEEWKDCLELGEIMGTTGDVQRLAAPK